MPSAWIIAASAVANSVAQPLKQRANDGLDLIAKLKTESTRLERFQDILTDGQDLLTGEGLAKASKFDFNTQWPVPGGEEGTVSTVKQTLHQLVRQKLTSCQAYVDNYPILIDSGISFSIASLGPCGVFFPHVHPRANELFTVIEGQVSFGYMLEASVLPTGPDAIRSIPPVSGNLTKFEGTLFPQGSIHYQINNSEKCERATIVATLSSEDAGTTVVLQQVDGDGMMMVKDKPQADIGDIEQYFPLLPPAIINVAKQCLARCRT